MSDAWWRVSNAWWTYPNLFTIFSVKVLLSFNTHLNSLINIRSFWRLLQGNYIFELRIIKERLCLLVIQIIKENTKIVWLTWDSKAGSMLYTSRKFPFIRLKVSNPKIVSTFYLILMPANIPIMNTLCIFLGLTTFSMAYGEYD